MISATFLLLISIENSIAVSFDNSVIGLPEVDCMEDHVKLIFHTEKPFSGRIFVKGMVDKNQCVNSFDDNLKSRVEFKVKNDQCNMRRSRKLGPENKGIEQSITIIISFHNAFITKIDRAYRCTCFYMEADKVVTSQFDVSMLPTTDLIDTARMPLCTYSVRKSSINGAIVNFANVGEQVFHVWQCESDMFSMLVHSCFVDDGNGKEKKPLIDEYGCAIEPAIVPDLTYNFDNNLASTEISVFKFADKVTTYFQCAISTCMTSEGMCKGKTVEIDHRTHLFPPHCGGLRRSEGNSDNRFSKDIQRRFIRQINQFERNSPSLFDDGHTMDVSTDKIIVLDLDEEKPITTMNLAKQKRVQMDINEMSMNKSVTRHEKICFSAVQATLYASIILFTIFIILLIISIRLFRRCKATKKQFS